MEGVEEWVRKRNKIAMENAKFRSRIGGVDFDADRDKLRQIGREIENKFSTGCFKHNNIFRN